MYNPSRMSDKSSPPLVKDDRVMGTHIYVGTNVWFHHWLTDPALASFRYECPEGSFTARRRKGDFWNAYRKVKGKLRQEYLGKSSDLTQTKLIETARMLAMENTAYWQMKYPRPEPSSQVADSSSDLYNQSEDCITEVTTKETTNAIRQWCVFCRHSDGKLQFMGNYDSRGDANQKILKSKRQRHLSESMGDHPYVAPPTYEIREMLVAPVGLYNQSDNCITDKADEVGQLKVTLEQRDLSLEELEHQHLKLKHELEKAQEAIVKLTTEGERLNQLYNQCITESQSTKPSIDTAALLNRLKPLLGKGHKLTLSRLEEMLEYDN